MGLVQAKEMVHFSLPVKDVEEALKFYTEVLGMEFKGRIGGNGRCVVVGNTHIVLTEERDFHAIGYQRTDIMPSHQAFYVSSEDYDRAMEAFQEYGVNIEGEEWRKTGTFTGRSLYFFDPSGNRLEINDPNPPYWPEGLDR